MLFAAVHESAYGTKRTWRSCSVMSAFGGKADIRECGGDVLLQKSLQALAF
jgi:hypothetical protein